MAIKVNGTTVINDSRALTNIASVDATTATAIGAAGVGGAMSLISTTTFSSTTLVTLTLPTGYNFLRVEFFDVLGGGSSTSNISYVKLMLSNASGTLLSGYEYYASDWNGQASNVTSLTNNLQIRCANNAKARFHIDITSANDVNVKTTGCGYGTSSISANQNNNYWGKDKTSRINRDLVMGDNGNFGFTSGTYNVWGIK